MIMNEYETIYVTRPDLDSDEQTRLDEKLETLISKTGTILVKEAWGKRRMAYEIQKHGFGHYTYVNYVAPAEIPTEIERQVKIEDNVIRFLTVKLEDTVDIEESRVVAEERQRKRAEKRATDAESRGGSSSSRSDSGERAPAESKADAAKGADAPSETVEAAPEATPEAAPAVDNAETNTEEDAS